MPAQVFNFSLEGGEQLAANLLELPKFARKPVLRAAAKKALEPVRQAAEANAKMDVKKRSGLFGISFIITSKLSKGQKRHVKYKEDALSINMYVGSDDPKAHLLEFGHITPSGNHTRAFPVLREAWDTQKDEVWRIFREELAKELSKKAKSLAKRAEANKLSAKQRKEFYLR